jgi:hypothetical protein
MYKPIFEKAASVFAVIKATAKWGVYRYGQPPLVTQKPA